ncbi:hypothetical protein AGMMS49960_03170 [Betaproteobacteria bacterium]|nr:hypothetical protein AGMMS49543_01730 [Betaproteobacteria bacterium]GHT98982.1 hypothetical protein AGMMS49960_03170 [Betaproteobacteria bacterium]GHU19581.1 hypothetical protein AGMMS50243_11930 [Betaproteobacteria bacterium]
MDNATGGAGMDGELQIALVAVGITIIVLLILYNKWQERRHSRKVDKAFRSDHPDVLLNPGAGISNDGDDRFEPRLSGGEGEGEGALGAGIYVDGELPASYPSDDLRRLPLPPPAVLDPRVDCIIRIDAIDAVEVVKVWAEQTRRFEGLSRPLYWFAFDDGENLWRPIDAHSSGASHKFLAALQLVNRQGPISEGDFLRFTGSMQRLAEQFHAVPEGIPHRAEVLGAATELDRFCESVDKLIVINVVANDLAFPATKIRGIAESAGLQLSEDGSFHAVDDSGQTLYVLGNCEPTFFTAEGMSNLQTRAVSLTFEVPRVSDGVAVVERMMQFAVRLAEVLDGVVVDDDGHAFGAEALGGISGHIQQFQARMAEVGIDAGSPLALRLFDA